MEIKLVPLTSENYSEIVHVNNAELPDLATIKWYEEKSTPNTVLLSLAGIASNGSYVGYGRYGGNLFKMCPGWKGNRVQKMTK